MTLQQARRLRGADDQGSAPLEFVAVAGVLVVLVLGIVQVGLWSYGRTVVEGAAREGARAARGGEPSDALAKARETLEGGLGGLGSEPTVDVVEGEGRVRVTVGAILPSLVPFLDTLPVRATANVRRETLRDESGRGQGAAGP